LAYARRPPFTSFAIHACGFSSLAICRRKTPSAGELCLRRCPDCGTPDTTFDGDAIVKTPVPNSQFEGLRDAVLLPDGKILGVGAAAIGQFLRVYPLLARYNPNGSLDTTFDSDGFVLTDMPVNARSAARIRRCG